MVRARKIVLFHVDLPEHKAGATGTILAIEFSPLQAQIHKSQWTETLDVLWHTYNHELQN